MASTDERLDPARRDAVLDRLGFSAPPPVDLAGLTAVYGAWCSQVPFDNLRKLIALHGGRPGPLPGLGAEDFFDAWLAHGSGGTCWPSANALHALLDAIGFRSRRVTASMFDQGQPSHGTTIVTIDGGEHLVDSSMLTRTPLPLDPAGPTTTPGDGFVHRAQPVAEGWLFDFTRIAIDDRLPCRTLSPDATPLAFFEERYEVSRTWSPFNEHLNVLVNRPDGAVSHTSGHLYHRPTGAPISELTGGPIDATELRSSLVEEIGCSEQLVDELFRVWTPPPPTWGARPT